MNGRTAIICLLLVLAAALGAGCTQSPAPATPTPTPVTTVPPTTPGTVPTPTLGSLVPGPTVTVPPVWEVAVDVLRDSNTYTRQITVIFQGGKGQSATQRVDVVDTHDDLSVETKSITRPESGSIPRGSSVSFTGTQVDRIEVTVWQNGIAYKIYDQVLPLATRP